MKKSAAAQLLGSLPGFRKAGSFFIGKCNTEVISGYSLDAPPGSVYIWQFVLPAFDRIEFLHLSLGKRLAAYDASAKSTEPAELENLRGILKKNWEELSSVHDANSLLGHLDKDGCDGNYCEWVRYLAHVRAGDFEAADRIESGWRTSAWSPGIRSVADSMSAALEARGRTGWTGLQELLTDWANDTTARFCQASSTALPQ